ncbi:hypothetical protein AVEN_34703-1 [Araneus ventricosus]|uniref:Uncharacterized protein n=1 Tax=Araneus ventricosus TaxID=182803 RepID=A0A4Y2AZN6_ARAVE|nr:hypothetical protein AVEN_34703-1 [Araneus ventricosus]
MALTFLPSLQHLAAVRVALTVYNDDIIRFLDELYLREKYDVLDPYHFNFKEEIWIRKCIEKTRKKLWKCLPKSLQNSVVHIIQPIVSEIHFWARDHFHVIKHIEKRHYKNSLCWKSEGTIDRTKTAEQLVRNENISKPVRFVLACIYFLENDVVLLWQSMTARERNNILSLDSNTAVNFWIKWLRKQAKSPWTQFLSTYNFIDRLALPGRWSRIRLSLFFNEMNWFHKIFYLHASWPHRTHIDDLRMCYILSNETERAQFFGLSSIPKDLLLCYLDWPLQSLFLDAINQIRSHLNRHCFECSLEYIVYTKLMRGMQDFDYLRLLRDLWNQIPDTYKEEIQRKKIFTLVHAAMNYDEKTHRQPIAELLKEFLFKNEFWH